MGVDDEIISAKLIQFADKFTIVGDWKFMEDRNDKAGLLKAIKFTSIMLQQE